MGIINHFKSDAQERDELGKEPDLSSREKMLDYTQNVLRKQPKKRIISDYGVKDLYNYYKSITVEGLQKPYSVFKAVITDANIEILDKVIKEAKEMKFLCGIGRLRIKKTKMSFKDTNGLRIDWAATKKANKKVYHTNEHRNNYRYKFQWCKGRIPGVTAYSFIATRTRKRQLAKILKTDKTVEYHEY